MPDATPPPDVNLRFVCSMDTAVERSITFASASPEVHVLISLDENCVEERLDIFEQGMPLTVDTFEGHSFRVVARSSGQLRYEGVIDSTTPDRIDVP